MAADDYVRGRTAAIDFDVALPGGYAAPTEIRRAVEWIREWNLGDGRSRPVGVYGADLPNRSGSMIPALDRLAELTEENRDVQGAIEAVRPTASRIAGDWWKAAIDKYDALSPEAKTALAAGVARLVERVEAVSDADRERLAWARRVAIVVRQHEEMLRLGPFSPARDRAMADNTLWVVGRIGSGERAVYWAHNAHVQRVRVNGPSLPAKDLVPAGAHFQEALGDRYYAIGTAYGGTAVDKSAMPNEEESVDRVLETVAKGPFLLTWRGAGAPRRAEAWLARVRPMRFQVQYLEVALGPAFDAVAYFGRATPAARAKKNPS
jgi:erythromycin esterase-like protein